MIGRCDGWMGLRLSTHTHRSQPLLPREQLALLLLGQPDIGNVGTSLKELSHRPQNGEADISSNLRLTAKPRATSTTVGPKNGQRIAPKPNHAAAQVNPYPSLPTYVRHGARKELE